jgi:hypothetical protein
MPRNNGGVASITLLVVVLTLDVGLINKRLADIGILLALKNKNRFPQHTNKNAMHWQNTIKTRKKLHSQDEGLHRPSLADAAALKLQLFFQQHFFQQH